MKKIILMIAIFSSTAFADYIPTKDDRGMKSLCKAIVSNKTDYYEAENDIFYLGLMHGAVEMAIIAHIFNKEAYTNNSITDIVNYVCMKTISDKNVYEFGFKRSYNLNAYLSTVK